MSDLHEFFIAAPQDTGNAVSGHYYQMASANPARPQVWGYSDRISYAPGDTLHLHAMSSTDTITLRIERDGLNPQTVLETTIPGGFSETPADCSQTGCGWPERHALTIPQDWKSGVYRITFSIPGHESQHMVVLRSAQPAARIAMVLATGTWCAYNDWGGSNHYQGLTGPNGTAFAATVSVHRPWAKGFVAWPADAPRIPHSSPPNQRPSYPHMAYARANGVSKKYASSGWAAFERPFALWCEAQGIALDYLTQHDLHANPGALNAYPRALIVGHDEYWTWEMRDHLEAWVDQGGQLCRFAGNFFWQTRLSDDLATQTCYKTRAGAEDPIQNRARMTDHWDHHQIARPATLTMGLTGAAGVYAGWSRCAAHGAGGFTIYRPNHWAMRGSGMGYGDVLGRDARIFAYEVDGIDYTMTHGLPQPSPEAALAGTATIIGLSPATTLAHSADESDRDAFIGSEDAEDLAMSLFGEVTPDTVARVTHGNGAMVDYRRGRGGVFNAGSCEWVAGLIARDPSVEQVTRNVLTGDWG
ncbi:MAG: N,N-dimethylformamidase beta subunit family domain-containing protein [Paracoccaceae bacterium]